MTVSANEEGSPEVDDVVERGRCSRCSRIEGQVLLLILEAAGGLSSAAELWLVLYLAARDVSWTLVVGALGRPWKRLGSRQPSKRVTSRRINLRRPSSRRLWPVSPHA